MNVTGRVSSNVAPSLYSEGDSMRTFMGHEGGRLRTIRATQETFGKVVKGAANTTGNISALNRTILGESNPGSELGSATAGWTSTWNVSALTRIPDILSKLEKAETKLEAGQAGCELIQAASQGAAGLGMVVARPCSVISELNANRVKVVTENPGLIHQAKVVGKVASKAIKYCFLLMFISMLCTSVYKFYKTVSLIGTLNTLPWQLKDKASDASWKELIKEDNLAKFAEHLGGDLDLEKVIWLKNSEQDFKEAFKEAFTEPFKEAFTEAFKDKMPLWQTEVHGKELFDSEQGLEKSIEALSSIILALSEDPKLKASLERLLKSGTEVLEGKKEILSDIDSAWKWKLAEIVVVSLIALAGSAAGIIALAFTGLDTAFSFIINMIGYSLMFALEGKDFIQALSTGELPGLSDRRYLALHSALGVIAAVSLITLLATSSVASFGAVPMTLLIISCTIWFLNDALGYYYLVNNEEAAPIQDLEDLRARLIRFASNKEQMSDALALAISSMDLNNLETLTHIITDDRLKSAIKGWIEVNQQLASETTQSLSLNEVINEVAAKTETPGLAIDRLERRLKLYKFRSDLIKGDLKTDGFAEKDEDLKTIMNFCQARNELIQAVKPLKDRLIDVLPTSSASAAAKGFFEGGFGNSGQGAVSADMDGGG